MQPNHKEILKRLIERLYEEYHNAVSLKQTCPMGTQEWWWLEGQRQTSELCLLCIGINPDDDDKNTSLKDGGIFKNGRHNNIL